MSYQVIIYMICFTVGLLAPVLLSLIIDDFIIIWIPSIICFSIMLIGLKYPKEKRVAQSNQEVIPNVK